jgi:hypothetical protein
MWGGIQKIVTIRSADVLATNSVTRETDAGYEKPSCQCIRNVRESVYQYEFNESRKRLKVKANFFKKMWRVLILFARDAELPAEVKYSVMLTRYNS